MISQVFVMSLRRYAVVHRSSWQPAPEYVTEWFTL